MNVVSLVLFTVFYAACLIGIIFYLKNKMLKLVALAALALFTFIVLVNSSIIDIKLSEDLGGGAKHKQQYSEEVQELEKPEVDSKVKDYQKEGKEALDSTFEDKQQ